MNQDTFIASKLEWKQLFDAIDTPTFLINEQLNIIESNQKAVDLYGYSETEFKLLNLCDIRAPYTRSEIEMTFNKDKKDSPVVFETRHLKKDGTEFFVELSTRPIMINETPYYIHLVKDISKWKQSELNLISSEKRYHDLINTTPISILIQSENGLLYINPAGIKLLGLETYEDAIGKSFLDFLDPDYQKEVARKLDLIQRGQKFPLMEEKIICRDGKVTFAEVSAKLVCYLGMRCIEVCMLDITRRKAVEQYSEHAASIINSSEEAIIGCSTNGTISYWNTAAEKLYGYKTSYAKGKPITSLIPFINNITELLQTTSASTQRHYQEKITRLDHTEWNVDITVSPIKNIENTLTGLSFTARRLCT